MKTTSLNLNMINNYYELLKNLSPDNKLELIALLSRSILGIRQKNNGVLKKTFGAFNSDETAEEIIRKIKKSRNFSRKLESF